MPILGEGEDVYVEYTIPQEVKNLITREFLTEFRNQLFRIHEYWSLDTFAEEGIPMNTSTSGWHSAFGKACILTKNNELYKYHRSLEWYDSDIFDGELAEMLITEKLILGDLSKVIEEQLGIKEDDLRYCCDCGKLYTDDMVIKLPEDQWDRIVSYYRCLHCEDLINTSNGNKNATNYYIKCLEEVRTYNW